VSYTIDERNHERQQLLAEVLNPSTETVLARLAPVARDRVLDLGCGQGNTTRLLAAVLKPRECVGLEYDSTLVSYARARNNPPGVRFEQGDATALPFEAASFDVVFCRYLLIHMTDPQQVIREMLRVVRPGGCAIAYEADFIGEFADPPCQGLSTINKLWNGVFQSPAVGRHLVRYFRDAGGQDVQAGVLMQMEHETATIKRLYRLTAEAIGPRGVAQGLITDADLQHMLADLTRLEEDPESVLAKFPDVWVIAKR
jgi:ubiquinone/menaquinone biosynthesis C-methylase UbiE